MENSTKPDPTPLDVAAINLLRGLMEGQEEANEWDLAPGLAFLLHPSFSDPENYRLRQIEVPNDVWRAAEVSDILNAITATLVTPAMTPLPSFFPPGEEVFGVLLSFEAWGVMTPGNPNLSAELDAWRAAGHQLVDHPAAIELKQITAVTDERTHTIRLPRGGSVEEEFFDAPEGRLVDALRLLLAAAKTV